MLSIIFLEDLVVYLVVRGVLRGAIVYGSQRAQRKHDGHKVDYSLLNLQNCTLRSLPRGY